MNSIGLCVCDVCGTQSGDHAGWFVVIGSGSRMEILPWSDDLLSRHDCRHACCGEHVRRLIFSSAAMDFARNTLPFDGNSDGWNPASLLPPTPSERAAGNSLQSALDAVDSALQEPDADEGETRPFDA